MFVYGKYKGNIKWDGTIQRSNTWNLGIQASPKWEEKERGNPNIIIDEVRLYNRALSADEVKELYLFTSAFPPAK